MTAWFQYPITHGFYPNYDPTVPDTPHFADDIGTPFHTQLTALWPGVVKQADYAAWGGEVFIQPDDPSIPEYYYYHPDQLNVLPGQHVNAGQVIGLSGGENPGYPGALHPSDPQYSTGEHTHFGFFTNWINTPNGLRPQGPDITSYIRSFATGQTPLPGDSSNITTAASVTSATQPSWTSQITDGLVHTGLFIIAMLLVAFGFYLLFKKQIGQGIDTAKKVAVEAALA